MKPKGYKRTRCEKKSMSKCTDGVARTYNAIEAKYVEKLEENLNYWMYLWKIDILLIPILETGLLYVSENPVDMFQFLFLMIVKDKLNKI